MIDAASPVHVDVSTNRRYQVHYIDEGHEYWQYEELPDSTRRKRLVSVTQACYQGGLADPEAVKRYNETARRRGSDLHDILLAHTRGMPFTVPDNLYAPWQAVLEFLSSGQFKCESAEQIIFEPHVYAGRYDLVGILGRFQVAGILGRRHTRQAWEDEPSRDLIDMKVGSVPPWVGPQTMAYRRRLSKDLTYRRWALQVTDYGARLVPLNTDPETGRYLRVKDIEDERAFLAALTITQFKEKHHG